MTGLHGEGKLIPLDLVMDYPVNWDFWQVLRDLIQNFYDTIGYEHFHQEFEYHYEYEDFFHYVVTMRTRNHPFSYEWLTYFGGSTKTGKNGYVGNYGEGFKVCALCLMRMGYALTMESKDWRLEPCTYSKMIDGKEVSMLGYRIWEREDDGITELTIRHVPVGEDWCLKEALFNFYYPENPLFGKKIADTETYAIYERSAMPVPRQYMESRVEGILYFNYLARGELPFPLIILVKDQKMDTDNRERNVFLPCYVKLAVYRATVGMTSEDSLALLLKMEPYWSELPRIRKGQHADVNTWYYVICQLVRNISRNDELSRNFIQEHPKLVYLDRISSDTIKNRKIRAARQWYQASGRKERIVNPVFRLFGVRSLLAMHRQDMEETLFLKPTEKQAAQGGLLQAAYMLTVPEELRPETKLPEIVICDGYRGSPVAFCRKISGKGRKGFWNMKYEVESIVLDPEDYRKKRFYETFVKYATARFRAFGLDRSDTTASLLTYLGGWMFMQHETMEIIRERWEETAGEG